MEEELRCYVCKEFYREPVLLPCGHALCRTCAIKLQSPVPENDNGAASSDYQEADKASVSSETDSGVVCGSRPNSYAGTPAVGVSFNIVCPVCKKQVFLDDNGAEGLPPFRVMRSIVERFGGITTPPPAEEACQMCEGERRAAIVRCEQCSVRYCASCRDAWHPTRGPLAQHELRALGTTCGEHALLPVLYCNACTTPICQRCVSERHATHDTQALPSAARAHKTELSQSLQLLSEEAKAITEYIQSIKGTGDKINNSCEDLEKQIDLACSEIIHAVERRRDDLIRAARNTKSQAITNMKSLKSQAGQRLREATALLHFSIEALKETDHAAFLQVGTLLSTRARETASTLSDALEPASTSPALTLDIEPVLRMVKNMNFVECIPPPAPVMAVEACCARGCSATLAWRAPPKPAAVRGYVLELDDGLGGPFREVYCGRETVCTVDGLHYASLYSARVKAFNGAGEGPYSEIIGLQTSPVAWFAWEARRVEAEGLTVCDEGLSARGSGWQPRVLLADTPLARGRHYWTLTLRRHDGDADPAFGIARASVARDKMLGSDALGWAMYVDGARSWFVHGGAHGGRVARGASQGSVIGVLLDLDAGTLRFTLDGEPQGDIAFTGLRGVFYPAVSLNRGVAITLQPGLPLPPEELFAQMSLED